jgi:hypothetical protein
LASDRVWVQSRMTPVPFSFLDVPSLLLPSVTGGISGLAGTSDPIQSSLAVCEAHLPNCCILLGGVGTSLKVSPRTALLIKSRLTP